MYYTQTTLVCRCLLHMYIVDVWALNLPKVLPLWCVTSIHIRTYLSVYLNSYPVISLLDPVELDRE